MFLILIVYVLTLIIILITANSLLGATLSGISHTNGLHLFVNMYVFSSFVPPLFAVFGREELMGIFLAGATFSSLVSTMHKKLFSRTLVASVGASGGLLSMIAILCVLYPDSKLSIAFVDRIIPHSFSSQSAVVGLVCFDVLGIILRWQVLDHAAHLGGVIFGMLYTKFGHKTYKEYRQKVIQFWHENVRK